MYKNEELILLQMFIEGDDEAYKKICRHYRSVLWMQAHNLLKNQKEATAVVTDVFVKFYGQRKRLRIKDSLKAYFMSEVQKACDDRSKNNKGLRKLFHFIRRLWRTVFRFTEVPVYMRRGYSH